MRERLTDRQTDRHIAVKREREREGGSEREREIYRERDQTAGFTFE